MQTMTLKTRHILAVTQSQLQPGVIAVADGRHRTGRTAGPLDITKGE